MHVTCPIPAIRFYLLPLHICLIDVYRRRDVEYQCTIFNRWNTCHDWDPSWIMSYVVVLSVFGLTCVNIGLVNIRFKRLAAGFILRGAEVWIKGSTSEICVKVALNESLYEKSLPVAIAHSNINHSIISQSPVTREWTMCPLQAARPR